MTGHGYTPPSPRAAANRTILSGARIGNEREEPVGRDAERDVTNRKAAFCLHLTS